MSIDAEIEERCAAIEEQARIVESCADPATREAALALLRSVMELHKDAIARMLDIVKESPQDSHAIGAFLNEPLVKSVLLLHGLHPESVEARVLAALDELRPKVQRYGAELNLIAISDESVRVSLDARGQCGSTLGTLKNMVERELLDAAADAEIVIETAAQPEGNFVSLESLATNVNSQDKRTALVAGAHES